MKILKVMLIAVLFISIAIPVWAIDPKPQKASEKPVPQEEEGEKIEQHAPSVEVGDTRKFMRHSPLSSAKEDDWDYYY